MSKKNEPTWKVRFKVHPDGRKEFDRYDPTAAVYETPEERFVDKEPQEHHVRREDFEYVDGKVVYLGTFKESSWWTPGVQWLDATYEWDDTLTYVGYGRGRSAAYFEFESTEFGKLQMFISDMDKLVKTTNIMGAQVHGRWGFRKQGANIGVYRVGEAGQPSS